MSNQLVKILWLILISMNIASCKLMPYRNDFDCPVSQGLKCKSLYEVNKMADFGVFDPNYNKQSNEYR